MKKNYNYKILKFLVFFGGIGFAIFSTIYIFSNLSLFDNYAKVLEEEKLISIVNRYDCEVKKFEENSTVIYAYETYNSCPYLLDYLVFNDIEYKDFVFSLYEDAMDDYTGTVSSTQVDLGSGNVYKEKSLVGDVYIKLINHDNSILFIVSDIEDMEKMESMQKEMGYYREINFEDFQQLTIPVISLFVAIFGLSFINKLEHRALKISNGLGYYQD